MKRWGWFLSLLPFWAACLVGPAQAGPLSSLVVFGDSLSDNGHSITLGGTSPRVSDGRVAVDFVATALGVPLYNYAVTGARSDADNSDAAAYPALAGTGMANQVSLYLSSGADANALHIIAAGANDVLDAVLTTDLTAPGAIDHLIQSIVGNLLQAVGMLQQGSASKFLVALLPDMGLTPLAASLGISGDLTQLSAAVNAGLSAAFAGSDVTLFDTWSAQQSELATFAAAGKNVTGTCLGDGAATCDDYFFYDELHPTSAAHLALANDVLAAIPEPGALALAALALLAAAGSRRRAVRR